MDNAYWTARYVELTLEYKARYLSEPYLFNEALQENDHGQVTLIRTLIHARQQEFSDLSMVPVGKVMELVAEEYAAFAAASMVEEEKRQQAAAAPGVAL